MAAPDRVLVVGAGVAGASAASHLGSLTDAAVTVLERGDRPAAETTAKSGAFVGFWGHESPGAAAMLRYGIRRYRDRLASAATDARFVHGGRLRLATTEAGDRSLRESFAADVGADVPSGESATAEVGAPVQYLAGSGLAETLVLPGLDAGAVAGAVYSPGVGFVDDPAALARALLDRARAAGATVETGVRATAVLTDGERVTGLRTDAGRRSADAVVCAAGPWNRGLLATAGVDLPVRNTRGPMLTVDAPGGHGLPALYHEETGTYTRPNRDGTWYVGQYPGEHDDAAVLSPEDVPDEVPPARRRAMLDAAARLVPNLADATVRDEWVGVRTLTPDGGVVAGETAVGGLAVAAFNANGVQYAPAAGRTVAAALGAPGPDWPVDALAPGRFSE